MLTMRTLPLPSVRLTSLKPGGMVVNLASRSVSPILMGFPSSCRREPPITTVFPVPASALPFETLKSLYVKPLVAHAVRKSGAKARVIKDVGFTGYLLTMAGYTVVIYPRRGERQGRVGRVLAMYA